MWLIGHEAVSHSPSALVDITCNEARDYEVAVASAGPFVNNQHLITHIFMG